MSKLNRRELLTGRLGLPSRWAPAGAGLIAWQDGRRGGEGRALEPDPNTIAHVDGRACLAHLGMDCVTCVERCPEAGAIRLNRQRPVVDRAICTGCALCAAVCPAPTPAIRMVSRGR